MVSGDGKHWRFQVGRVRLWTRSHPWLTSLLCCPVFFVLGSAWYSLFWLVAPFIFPTGFAFDMHDALISGACAAVAGFLQCRFSWLSGP